MARQAASHGDFQKKNSQNGLALNLEQFNFLALVYIG
jgi:hypothetical protein